MIYWSLTIPRGQDAEVRIPIVHGNQNVDLTIAETKLWFTAKESKNDAYEEAVIARTYVAGGVSDGIAVEGADDNIAVISILKADLIEWTAMTILVWDCLLYSTASGNVFVAYGDLKVPLTVSDPP